ncbi:uncharacterized protein [Clytia hemisphaerica]|uniref:uncharacterized protein n=1 Tax=Clytia hemisphaerica TaxID=252671 RepID=UPI0034D73CB1
MNQGHPPIFRCLLCNYFQALSVRLLLDHYRSVHANQSSFNVKCNVDGCVATFSLYNSLYKHITRKHKEVYHQQPYAIQGRQQPNGEIQLNEEEEAVPDGIEHVQYEVDQHEGDDAIPLAAESSSSSSDVSDSEDDEQEQQQEVDNNDDNLIENSQLNLKKCAAMFLLKSKERKKLSQATTEKIKDNVSCLVSQHCDILKAKLIQELGVTEQEDLAKVDEIFQDGGNIFEGLSTEAQLKSFIKSTFSHVKPIEIVLGSILKRKRKKKELVLSEKNETYMYIPILETLEQMLNNTRIASLILRRPRFTGNGYFYDIFDGSVYTKDQYFKDHPTALAIMLFHDELEICNPLGSAATKYKIDMYYYCVANTSPKYRSRVCAVQLLAIAPASHVKKYGVGKILSPIIDDLILLYHGHVMSLNNEEQTVFGKVVVFLGDTLGQHLWGGFKEGVGGAFIKCRHCLCDFETLQTVFDLDKIKQRTKEIYDEQCTEIENATGNLQHNLKITYGINQRSPLCRLPNFDIITQLPQDIMHILFEGTVQYELRLVLKKLIYSLKVTSLDRVNGSIANHPYGYSELSSKPPPIRESVFENEGYKLKFEADQARVFLRTFPFVINSLVEFENEYVKLIIDLIEICQILISPVIGDETIKLLKKRVPNHLKEFKRLFPDDNVLPKHNYMLHFANSINELGPPIRYSCYSFEAAHKYLANHWQNVKILKTFHSP